MKIGILTQPLHDNYGGLLQAYALKTTLERLGHQVEIINRRKNIVSFNFRLRQLVKNLFGKKRKFELTKEQQNVISQHTNYFAKTYIKDITKPIYNDKGLKNIADRYDLFVIGSDQVWRPAYSPKISNYYLDFIGEPKVKGLAYAASFGVDYWEYTHQETKVCKENIHKFRAVSVREDSGVELSKNNLGIEAEHVVDPTLLLTAEDYINLILEEKENPVDGQLMHYVLDSDKNKESLIKIISEVFDLKVFTTHQKSKPNRDSIKNIEDLIFPKVTSWLNGFYSSQFVITDSFHGTVFSILFNKPFLVVSNEKRGRARFDSLLKTFHLTDRLVTNPENVTPETIKDLSPIDWSKVNSILDQKKTFAMNFLKSNLN